MEQAYPTPQSDIDDSALGRFRLSTGSSGSRLDFSRLSHHSPTSLNMFDLSSQFRASPKVAPVNDLGVAEEQSDLASTVSRNSFFAVQEINDNDSASVESEKAGIVDATTPDFEHRLVQDALIGPAPFTKSHFISGYLLAPFSGPHTVIQIPLGPDLGKYIHVPQDLGAAEIKLAELAIYWLWSGTRRHVSTEVAKPDEFGPKIPARLLKGRIIGPPEAPHSMTQSTFPPFLGPRTIILNTGAHLNGWLLHIPRYLNPQEIAIASKNLRDITNEVSSWGFRHDLDCTRCVTPSEAEHDVLMQLMELQNRNMALLKDVLGLDFAAHDKQVSGFEPIWKQQVARATGPETPKKQTPLPTPTTTADQRLRSPHSFSSLRSVADYNVHGRDVACAGIPTPYVAIPTLQSAIESTVPNALSKHEQVFSHENLANTHVTKFPPDSAKLPTLTRYSVVMEQEGECKFEYLLDDPFISGSEDDYSRPFLKQASPNPSRAPRMVQPSPARLHLPQIIQTNPPRHRNPPLVQPDPKAHVAGSTDDESDPSVLLMNEFIHFPCQFRCCRKNPEPSYCSFLLRKIYLYILLGLASFLSPAVFSTRFYNLQDYLFQPFEVLTFITENPGRRNAMIVLAAIVGPAVLLIIKDQACSSRVLFWVFLAMCGWLGCQETMTKDELFQKSLS